MVYYSIDKVFELLRVQPSISAATKKVNKTFMFLVENW